MPIVELQHVRKVYDTKIAVDDISFTIEPGTMFGLLGPNGSGKTSSIRMMIGITVPDSGTVRLFDKPFDRASLKRVGYLPEERGLYKKMKVMDQLIFLGELHGLDAHTASKRAHVWCERMDITEAIPKKTEELSKGMQQKIQFIAALLHDPDLIIMDEPFRRLRRHAGGHGPLPAHPDSGLLRRRRSLPPAPQRRNREELRRPSRHKTPRPQRRRSRRPAASRRSHSTRHPHLPLRSHGAHSRRDLHRNRRRKCRCLTSGSSQSASTSSASAQKAFSS